MCKTMLLAVCMHSSDSDLCCSNAHLGIANCVYSVSGQIVYTIYGQWYNYTLDTGCSLWERVWCWQ